MSRGTNPTADRFGLSSDNPASSYPVQRGLNTRSAANYLGFSEAYLRKARRGLTSVPGPKFRRIGGRVIYDRAFLDSWLCQFKVES